MMITTGSPEARFIERIAAVLIALVVLFCFLVVAERLYWVNGDSYSLALVHSVPIAASEADRWDVAALDCHRPVEISEKSNGTFARCGFFMGQTFVIDPG